MSRLFEHVQKRFPAFDMYEALATIFDPVKLAQARDPDYGLKEVKFLAAHYGREVKKGDITKRAY